MSCRLCGAKEQEPNRKVDIVENGDGTVRVTVFFRTECENGHWVGDQLAPQHLAATPVVTRTEVHIQPS